MIVFSDDFYNRVLKILIKKDILKKDGKILIAAGGGKDKNKFLNLDFKDVTISNLDKRMKADSFKPYKWSFQDVESLDFDNSTYDFVIIHHGLHHCSSPHKGLLELYRVAKYGVIAFEPIENFITSLGLFLGFSENFELTAVCDHEFEYGGFRNTGIPNYVYRWTIKEIKKTIQSYNPVSKVKSFYFYGLELPFGRLARLNNKLFYIIAIILSPLIFINFLIFHRIIANRFGFVILKPDHRDDRYPWLDLKNNKIIPNEKYFLKKFKKQKVTTQV